MRGLLGRDNPLSNAFELINRRMEEEAEAEKTKQALTYWNVTKNCLNCTKNLKCNLKELREDCTNIFKFHTGRRTRYYYDPFEVLEKIKGYKQYGNRHLSKEKIDEYCNSVKEAKEKSLEK